MQRPTSEERASNVSEVLADALLDAKVEELRRSIEALYMRIDELVSLKSKVE